MGTFGGYIKPKDTVLPEEKSEEFVRYLSRILNLGGMMDFEKVSMYEKELYLLKPVELSLDEGSFFHFNYFEDDTWENAGFNPKYGENRLWSNKIGSREFNDVIMAGYMLYEQYLAGGMAECNGDIISDRDYVGWINQVCGTSFSMKNRFDLWDRVEEYMECHDKLRVDVIRDIIPRWLERFAGGMDLTDLLYIENGTDDLTSNNKEIKQGSYPDDIRKCRELLNVFFENKGREGVSDLWELLKNKIEDREKEEAGLKEIAKMTLNIPARVFVYLTAERYDDIDFWKEWMSLRNEFYHDEVRKKYASKELMKRRKEGREYPIPKVRTSDFLKQDDFFTFYHDPVELSSEKNYYLSDDDRLYWWDGTDEVIISDKTDEWLKELAVQHKEIKDSEDIEYEGGDFLKFFLNTLVDADRIYGRLMPFQSMFYDFIYHGKDADYIAAVKLYKKLADSEEYKKAGEVIKYAKNKSWDMVSRNVTCNKARIRLKRYLSIMANKELRKKYFGF